MFSVNRGPAVSSYPDSDKVGVWTDGFDPDGLIFARDTSVPWSHGEDGWERADGSSITLALRIPTVIW